MILQWLSGHYKHKHNYTYLQMEWKGKLQCIDVVLVAKWVSSLKVARRSRRSLRAYSGIRVSSQWTYFDYKSNGCLRFWLPGISFHQARKGFITMCSKAVLADSVLLTVWCNNLFLKLRTKQGNCSNTVLCQRKWLKWNFMKVTANQVWDLSPYSNFWLQTHHRLLCSRNVLCCSWAIINRTPNQWYISIISLSVCHRILHLESRNDKKNH